MNKINKLITLITMGPILAIKPAMAENTFSAILDYGVPCAISMGASAVLMKNDGLVVGGTMCAAISAATALNRKKIPESDINLAVSKSMNEREVSLKSSLFLKLEERSKEISDGNEKRNDDLKKIIKEILADRLIKMEDDLRSSTQKLIESGAFIPELEKKISLKIKEEVLVESKVRSKELISPIVDEVIRQVVAKPIAVPDQRSE